MASVVPHNFDLLINSLPVLPQILLMAIGGLPLASLNASFFPISICYLRSAGFTFAPPTLEQSAANDSFEIVNWQFTIV